MSKKFLVLLSSGLDSAVNLYAAKAEGEVALALTFNYGQRAAKKEIFSAAKLTSDLGVPHLVVEALWLGKIGQSSLTDFQKTVPVDEAVDIESLDTSLKSMKSVWVPNRNGVFLNIAAAYAEGLGVSTLIAGFNKEEASTFPDNSRDFLTSLSHSFYYSTQNHVQADSFTDHMMKNEIVKLGIKLQVPFQNIWPCYFAEEKWCGRCESCQRAKRAFKNNAVQLEANFLE